MAAVEDPRGSVNTDLAALEQHRDGARDMSLTVYDPNEPLWDCLPVLYEPDELPWEPDGGNPAHSHPGEHLEHLEQLPHGTRLSSVAPERIDWLSRGRIATGKLTIIDGDPGVGKSSIVLDWGARLTRQWALPDGPVLDHPRAVVVMSAEDGVADTIRPRAEAAGADLNLMIALSERPDGSLLTIPGDIPLIEDVIQRADAVLLIIDPLVAFLPASVNPNADQDVRRALAPLAAMADRARVAVVLIRHMNKTQSSNPLYRGGGSIGIIGAARFGLVVAPDPDQPERCLVASSKCNLGKSPATLRYALETMPNMEVAQVQWHGTSTLTATAILSAAIASDTEQSAVGKARAFLRQFLPTVGSNGVAIGVGIILDEG